MAKGLPRSHAHRPKSEQNMVKHHIPLSHSIDSVTVTTAKGFGSVVIGDFPEGNILLLGAVSNVQVSGPGGSADLSDTWAGDYGIGTTPMSDATISTADEDLIPETALAAATAEVSPVTRAVALSASAGVVFDNTDGSLEINLNLLVDAADQGDDKTVAMAVTGDVWLSYVVLGDD